jgi:hypothetical protein
MAAPAAPVAAVVVPPGTPIGPHEQERVVRRPSASEPPLGEVLLQRRQKVDGPGRATGLLALQLAGRHRLLDQQRALANVPPLEGERFLRAQAGVCEQRH